ncbi:DUF1643 domain-containing protein [Cupriavidus sp. DF5525]|uniref:DUF1643 domain-containing protein n=1 Tax=Cupriavidus sp. DF5525 TaxID=3160989 RepID=UPI0032DEBB09
MPFCRTSNLDAQRAIPALLSYRNLNRMAAILVRTDFAHGGAPLRCKDRSMKHMTTQTLDGEAGCLPSDCEQYRYRLWRHWDASRPTLGFIMLNPSTADHQVNDPTITRCCRGGSDFDLAARGVLTLRAWHRVRRWACAPTCRRRWTQNMGPNQGVPCEQLPCDVIWSASAFPAAGSRPIQGWLALSSLTMICTSAYSLTDGCVSGSRSRQVAFVSPRPRARLTCWLGRSASGSMPGHDFEQARCSVGVPL